MGGSWLDWLIVLIGCVLLLPRLLAYAVNTSLIRYAQAKARQFGLSLECELGSISLRALCDIHIHMGRWRLPQHPNLYAAMEISIQSIALQIFKKKPITACMTGAKVIVRLSEENAHERQERERLEAIQEKEAAACKQAEPCPVTAAAHPPLRRAEISTRSLAATAEAIEASVIQTTTAATDSKPEPFLVRWQKRCVLKLLDWFAICIKDTEITVQRGDVHVSVCDVGFSIWAGDGSTSTNRQLHLGLSGLAVRIEQLSTHAAFRHMSGYKSDDEKLRIPPLLQILPTEFAFDMQIQRCIPVGLDSIDIQCGGLEVSLDPTLQLEAIQRLAVEFQEQIKDLKIHLPKSPTTPTPTPQHSRSHSPNSSHSSSSSSSSASSLMETYCPLSNHEYCGDRRQFMLRFLPKQTKFALEHFKIELLQREETNQKGDKTAASSPNDLRRRNNASKKDPPPPTPVISSAAYSPPPILHSLLLRFNKVSILTSLKTTYPVSDLFGDSTPPDENYISSVDWSVNMTGPSIWMSQQGLVYPRVDVEYCKFTGHTSANYATALSTHPHDQHHHAKQGNFPLATPLHASATAASPSATQHPPSGRHRKLSAPSSTSASSTDFHPVDSLFHPTNAYRPQTVHTLTFVCVSLRSHLFPSSADWSQYVIQTIRRGQQFVEGLPLPKAPPANTSLLVPPPIDTHQAVRSPSSSMLSQVTSPESYTRQISLQRNSSPMPAATNFPQFPFPTGASAAATASTNILHPVPSAISTLPTSSPGSSALLDQLDNPYQVQSAVTINVKVVDFHLAIYPKLSDTLPLCHLSLNEVSLRYETKPPSLTHTLPLPTHTHTNSSSLPNTPERSSIHRSTQLVRASERIELIVSGFVGSMPQEVHNPYALSFHSSESLQVPNRFFQLNSASMIVDKQEKEIMFTADGLTIRWSVSVLLMGPPLVGLLIQHLPTSPATHTHIPQSLKRSLTESEIDLKFVRGTVTNVTVDFPYLLEFKSDAAQSDPMLDILSPNLPKSNSANENKDPSPLPLGSIGSSSAGYTRSVSPPNSNASATASNFQTRSTSLFTYQSSIINLDVNILADSWSLLLYQSNCLSEGESFLTLLNASIGGSERSSTHPKSMSVTGDQIIGSWRPALQLGLFKVVKDCVSAAINFKYALCQVVPSWRKYCFERTQAELDEEERLNKVIEQIIRNAANKDQPAESATPSHHPTPTGVDYLHDPMVHLLSIGGKTDFITTFRTWFHTIRARHLPEPFMHVKLHTTNLLFDAALNRQETLGCLIRVKQFSSNFLPHQYSFLGVEIDFMKKPIVYVAEVHLNRVGLPNLIKYSGNVASTEGTPPATDAVHPLMHFTEEHNLLANYLDISLEFREVRVEIAPALDIGGVIDLINLKVQALVQGILDLPTLNTLSRRLNGPGYIGPPDVAPPSVLLSITACQFEIVDEPFESWLQHLHLLWLDERAEQERRRALLKLKIEMMHKETSKNSNDKTAANQATNKESIESGLYHELSEWNSRSYYTRVESLKRAFKGSDSLKKAPLLNLTISSMLMAIGFEGVHGSFYQTENVLKVIRIRKQEEEEGWNEMAKRRSKCENDSHNHGGGSGNSGGSREHSNSDGPRLGSRTPSMEPDEQDEFTNMPNITSSPTLSSDVGPDIPDSLLVPLNSNLSRSTSGSHDGPASNPGGPRIGFLSARYFKVSLSEIQVRLRNFPLPLFECVEASMSGHTALVQIKNEPSATIKVTEPALSLPSSSHHHPHGHRLSDPLSPTAADRASVSIGGVHVVAVEKKYRPFQLFYDIEGSLVKASVTFSPCFLYTLRDVYDAMDRVVPPLPELHPIQPIPGMIGLSGLGLATTRKGAKPEAQPPRPTSPPVGVAAPAQEIDPVNYIHLFRGIAHGRFSLSVKDTEIKLLASNDPYESSKYLKLNAGLCNLSFEKSIFKVEVQQINALQFPSRPKQPYLMELPQLELHTTILWICTESHKSTPTNSTMELLPQPTIAPVTGPQGSPNRTPRKPKFSTIRLNSMTPMEQEEDMAAMASPPLTRQNSEIDTGPVDPSESQHVCNMHLSLSLYFSAHQPNPGPLSLTLHSGSLASLVQFSQVYATIPPLPFPRRTPLTMIDVDTIMMVRPLSEIRSLSTSGVPTGAHTPINSPISASPESLTSNPSATPSDPSVSPLPPMGISIFNPNGEIVLETTPQNRDLTPLQLSPGDTSKRLLTHVSEEHMDHSSLSPIPSSHTHLTRPVAPAPWKPKPMRVELHGLYLERILLDKIHLTIWEGANLGPARGLRLSLEHVYLALELQEEVGLTNFDSNENLKQNKFCFPFKKMNLENTTMGVVGMTEPSKTPSSQLVINRIRSPSIPSSSPSTHSRPSTNSISPSPSTSTLTSSTPSTAASMIYWSLSNSVCGFSKLSGLLVYNDRWREMSKLESESTSKIDSIFAGSRVVIYTYENQRYTLGLGWSSRNLLPTDRSPWTNESGTQKLNKEDVKLPSDDWEWEGEWHLDFQLRKSGEVDEEGWEYAHDFPRKYSRVRTWYCNVRRRRWIRVRKLKTAAAGLAMPEDSTRRSASPVTSPVSDGNSSNRRLRPGMKSENAENFVLSLARVTVQQKQNQHSSDISMLVLDRERALFRLITAPIFSRCNGRSPPAPTCSPTPRLCTGMVLPQLSTARRHSLSRSNSSQDRFTSQSLLNFFHIPPAASNPINKESQPTTTATSPVVHHIHRLNEAEYAEAQLAQDELKRLHATTSSIVTVGGGLGMNPTVVRPDDTDQSPQINRKGVRFNEECVLDSVRAERRRKSFQLQSRDAYAECNSSTSLCRPDLASIHSVRLFDFKILLTIEIRSTLITLIDQYVATMMELVEKQREREKQAKYTKQGKIILGEMKDENGANHEKTMSQLLNENDSHHSSRLSDDFTDSLNEGGPRSPGSGTPSPSPPSPRSQSYSFSHSRHDSILDQFNPNDPSMRPQRGTSGTTMKNMDDFLREDEVESDDPDHPSELDCDPRSPSILPAADLPDKRNRSMSTVAGLSSYRPDALHATIGASPTGGSNFIDPGAAYELFVLEIINPQINVHSEETRGRILFMTQKLAVHGRVHFKSGQASLSLSSAQATTSPTISSRTRAGTDANARMNVTSPIKSSSVTPPLSSSSSPDLDKLVVSLMIDQLQAFVAPTDVDVDAGVIWLSSSTAGILKSIMQPSSFICTISLRPHLPAFSKPQQPNEEVSHFGDPTKPAKSGRKQISKATQHMSHHHHGLSHEGHNSANSAPSDLHSIDLNLPELVLAMDSYQWALFLDVMKTVTSPLPIQAINHSLDDDDIDENESMMESITREEVDNDIELDDDMATLADLKKRATVTKAHLTVLEWEMRHIEWILAGLGQPTSTKPSETDTTASTLSPSSTTGATDSKVGPSSFSLWLLSTTSKYRHGSVSSDLTSLIGFNDIQLKFHELLREHSIISTIYLRQVLEIRLKELDMKPQTAPQNISLNVFLNKISFNLRKQEKDFLSLYVEGVSAAVHLYDDASADMSLEVAGFGARNTMPAYLNPANKEYSWAEVITPLVLTTDHPPTNVKDDQPTCIMAATEAKASSAKTSVDHPTENIHQSDMLISIHGVKREEFHAETNQTMMIIQHLELNIYPLQVRCTYDTLSAMTEFFVQDQQKFMKSADGTADESAAAIKNKKQYTKYKNKFLPSGGLLDQDHMNNAQTASSGKTKDPKHSSVPVAPTDGKGKKGFLDAIKHSRVVSVAKEFYHAHTSSTPTAITQNDLYDHEPNSSIQPFSPPTTISPNPSIPHRTGGEEAVGAEGMVSNGSASNLRGHFLPNSKQATKVKTLTRRANSNLKLRLRHTRIYHFVYVRFGSTLVNVSYWGNKQNATNNIEDFQGLKIKFKQILFQKKLWSMKKFVEHLQKELFKNFLGQVGQTLGHFISYKLGFRTGEGNSSSSQPIITVTDSERASQIWLGSKPKTAAQVAGDNESDNDDEPSTVSVSSYPFAPSPDSSALLAHFDNELATSSSSQIAADLESAAVKSLLFGAKKSKSKKLVESIVAILPSKTSANQTEEKEQHRHRSNSSATFLHPADATGGTHHLISSRPITPTSNSPSAPTLAHTRSPSLSISAPVIPPRPPKGAAIAQPIAKS